MSTRKDSTVCSAAIVYRRNRDCWSAIPILLTSLVNTGLRSTSMTMNITENISTRADVHPLIHVNVTGTNIVANGFTIVNSYRVLLTVSVDIILHRFVFSEVMVSICVAFCAILLAILDVTMSSCMNWYVTYSIVRRHQTTKRMKYILCFFLHIHMNIQEVHQTTRHH